MEEEKHSDALISINTNSLEDIYIKIDNQANKEEFEKSDTQIQEIMSQLYIKEKNKDKNSFKIFIVMVHHHFN